MIASSLPFYSWGNLLPNGVLLSYSKKGPTGVFTILYSTSGRFCTSPPRTLLGCLLQCFRINSLTPILVLSFVFSFGLNQVLICLFPFCLSQIKGMCNLNTLGTTSVIWENGLELVICSDDSPRDLLSLFLQLP